jgi:O-antigen ligase
MRSSTLSVRPALEWGAASTWWWGLAGVAAAFTVAVTTSHSPVAGFGATLAIVSGIAVFRRPAALLFILAPSIYFEIVRAGGTTISRVLAPIALLTVLVQFARRRVSIRTDRPLMWATVYALWAFASGIWTTSLGGTAYLLSSLAIAVAYMMAFSSLLDSSRDLERMLCILAFTSFLVGFLSFPRVSGTLGFGNVLQAGRSEGAVGDPNLFGAVQLIALPLIIVLAGEVKKRWLRLCLYAAIIVNIGSILTSLSRGAFLGMLVFLVLVIVLPSRLLFHSRRQKAIALLVVALGATAISIRHSSSLAGRVETMFGGGSSGAQQGSGRIGLWMAARTSVHRHPWFGRGYGAFPSASNDLLLETPGVDFRYTSLKPGGQPVHNTYLESLTELGVLGPLLYVALLVSTMLMLRRTAIRAWHAGALFVSKVAWALGLGLATWSVTSFFLSAETSRIFWIVIGLSLALPKLLDSIDLAGERASS